MKELSGENKRMHLRILHPLPTLQHTIARIWVFENDGEIPKTDLRRFMPNGRAKLLLPIKNNLNGTYPDSFHHAREHRLTFVGCSDISATIDGDNNSSSTVLGIEFTATGAYRCFRFPQHETTNRIAHLTDLDAPNVSQIENRLFDESNIEEKAVIIQNYLLRQMWRVDRSHRFEHAVASIVSETETPPLAGLANKLGISTRWLRILFERNMGISPRKFASLIRFHSIYAQFARNGFSPETMDAVYALYYDQPHFIREFKRFAGVTPTILKNTGNAFGNLFA